jgi:hypothetical protein
MFSVFYYCKNRMEPQNLLTEPTLWVSQNNFPFQKNLKMCFKSISYSGQH